MKNTGTINTKNLDSDENAVIVVRHDQDKVALTVSLEKGNDTEVLISKEDAQKLLEILKTAIEDNS
jgi:hypothetical protein